MSTQGFNLWGRGNETAASFISHFYSDPERLFNRWVNVMGFAAGATETEVVIIIRLRCTEYSRGEEFPVSVAAKLYCESDGARRQ
jgi:hypothetical protein